MLIKLFKDVTFINFALADISKSANQFVNSITTNLGSSIVNIIAALTILLLGLLLAAVIATTTRSLLKRTRFDDRIANKFRSNPNELGKFKLEKWIPIGIFGIIFGVSLIAFFEALQLKQFTKPINVLLKNINSYLPSLLGAAILLVIAWLLAKIVKFAATRSIRLLQLDERFNNQVEDLPQQNQLSISNAVPQALYWFILLFFLPIILDTLGLQATLEPVQKLVGEFLLYLPNILGALLIALLGWIIARTVRTIISSFLTAIGVDQLGAKFGMSTTAKGSLSWLGGTSVYVFILIFTAISALNKLDITTVSAPAIVTLNQVFVVIPQIITAIAILVIGYIAGKYVGELLRNVLTGINFNNLVMQLGLPNQLFNNENNSLILTPSEIVGTIARIGIILFATVTALDILNLTVITAIIQGIIIIFASVLAGLLVLAIGLYFARLAFNLIITSGISQARILAQTARITIIAFVSTMALQQIGIAPDIVNLAFGLCLGAISVSIALAIGLGSREIAGGIVRGWLNSLNSKQ